MFGPPRVPGIWTGPFESLKISDIGLLKSLAEVLVTVRSAVLTASLVRRSSVVLSLAEAIEKLDFES